MLGKMPVGCREQITPPSQRKRKLYRCSSDKGIKKSDLSRDEFLKYAWEWKEKYGGIILDQLKKLRRFMRLGSYPFYDGR
jgi:hypothetical protein